MTTSATDRFGNPIDPACGYAWGSALRSHDDEVRRMLAGRGVIRGRVAARGDDAVYNMTGLIRAFPLRPEDLPGLTSQLRFYARFSGEAEALALKHMGGDPGRHGAAILTRVSAAMLAVMLALDVRGRRVLSLVPGGRSHPSIGKAVELVGGTSDEVVGVAALAERLEQARPDLLVISPITPQKYHMPAPQVREAAVLARTRGVRVFVDDAHMASRMAFFDEAPALAPGDVDLAVWSLDKHIDGPRAAAVAGDRALVERVCTRAFEFGLEAQSGHYVAAVRALEHFDVGRVREVAGMAHPLLDLARRIFGDAAYLAGPGVAVSGEDLVSWALARRGLHTTPVVPNEAVTAASFAMLREHGLVTIPTVAMPGSAATFRLMVYPDGPRLGLDGFARAIDTAARTLVAAIDDPSGIAQVIFGESAR
jgi:L-seryl-tRNA(Ser) seleniumtransferase